MYRIGQEEINELKKVVETKEFFKINDVLEETRMVENKLKKLFNVTHPIFMTSGHAALTSALVALGIGPGDQVIIPAYTYIATAIVVVAAGAIPVIAEVDDTLTLDPVDVERKITKHTKAIIPVHIQGFPCNMAALKEVADKHNLYIIEDSCQADGGSFKGQRLGTFGNAGALSFNYFKLVSSGEGGALLTSDPLLFERALIYHDSGAVSFFGDQLANVTTPVFCGQEFRANEFCAAVMNIQLDRMDGILADLRKNKKYLMDSLADVCKFIPSNDIDGDCGQVLAIQFETEEAARKFTAQEDIHGCLPIDTGKHVYDHWDSILEKRGAFNPLMDPFKMEANKDIIPDYRKDMCPVTLDKLSKVVYISIDPDWTTDELDTQAKTIRNAMSNL